MSFIFQTPLQTCTTISAQKASITIDFEKNNPSNIPLFFYDKTFNFIESLNEKKITIKNPLIEADIVLLSNNFEKFLVVGAYYV